eukprot:m.1228 g.1228  ORF g.1228 m.1228 type:complete len:86 (+) comp5903_c0_seq1:2213-2470(+)
MALLTIWKTIIEQCVVPVAKCGSVLAVSFLLNCSEHAIFRSQFKEAIDILKAVQKHQSYGLPKSHPTVGETRQVLFGAQQTANGH